MRNGFRILAEDYIFLTCKRHPRILLGLGAGFVIGLILGFALGGRGLHSEYIFIGSVEFTVRVFGGQVSLFSVILRGVAVALQYFALIFAFSLTVYLLPLHYIFIAYKGYIFGAAFVVFGGALGINGFADVLLLVLPQQLILLFFLCLYIAASYPVTREFYFCRSYSGIGLQFKYALTYFLMSLIHIVVQLLVLYVIIRPFNIVI
jgi:hypothetical protein